MVYEFDFTRMQQKSLGISCVRPIRRLDGTTSPKLKGLAFEEGLAEEIVDVGRRRAASMQELQRCDSGDFQKGQNPSCEVRYLHDNDEKFKLYTRTDLVAQAQRTLRIMAEKCASPLCKNMRDIQVTGVQAVMNMDLWNKYMLMRQQTVKALKNRQGCPQISEIAPDTLQLQGISPPCPPLEAAANEVLLLHGASPETALRIARHGFDERMSRRGRHGRGVHLTCNGCKAALACQGKGCIVVSRVTVGHPFIVEGPTASFDHPPEVHDCDHGPLHDSIVAQPGISIDEPGGGKVTQRHWEFIVTRGDQQIFPELLIHFECSGTTDNPLKRSSSTPALKGTEKAAGSRP